MSKRGTTIDLVIVIQTRQWYRSATKTMVGLFSDPEKSKKDQCGLIALLRI